MVSMNQYFKISKIKTCKIHQYLPIPFRFLTPSPSIYSLSDGIWVQRAGLPICVPVLE